MKNLNYIPVETFCRHHQIELTFIHELEEHGLIEITTLEKQACVPEEQLPELEKILRLHHDLDLNFAGIDTVLQLLNRMGEMQKKLRYLEKRLALYE